jgi:homospermidine synthase
MVKHRALILGCHGGVGRAVLSLLQQSAPGRRLREQCETLLLVDREPVRHPLPLNDAVLLPPARIACAADLTRLIREHAVTEVIDLSSVDTLDCTRACDELGVHFLTTSVEEWPGRGTMPTDRAIARLLPPRRPALTASHLVGSGANPGLVNALVFAAIREFAREVNVAPMPSTLGLHGILITEEDTTSETRGSSSDDVFAMTWSPRHCLEELHETRAFAARGGRVVSLNHPPAARWYQARCGKRQIQGMAVPHEEIVTLARRFPGIELAFVYRIPEAARRALAAHPRREPAAWRTRRLAPPWAHAIVGEDRLGVLLCSRRYGEFWMGFRTDVSAGLALGMNATQLQVAAGVLAGWSQLGERTGLHFVEDLDVEAFLAVATEVLGTPMTVHDPAAVPRSLAERQVATVRPRVREMPVAGPSAPWLHG